MGTLHAQIEKCKQFFLTEVVQKLKGQNHVGMFGMLTRSVFDGKRSEMHEMHERSGTSPHS